MLVSIPVRYPIKRAWKDGCEIVAHNAFLILAISPYDLIRDSPALLAGALLSDQLVTLLPAPLEGASPGAIREAVERHPAFLRYIESSRWISPLWHAGVLSPGPVSERGAHASILDDARAVCARVGTDPSLESLRQFVDPSVFDSTDAYLGGLARDLLRSGVSPSFAVTVSAAVDRFAARRGLPAIRSESSSKVGGMEKRASRPFLRLSMPVTRESSGEALMDARHWLSEELGGVRAALSRALEHPEERASEAALRESLAALEDAFADRIPEGSRTVQLACARQPADRVLSIASRAARPLAKKVRGRRATSGHTGEGEAGVALDLPPVVAVSARFSRVRAG